MRKSFKITLYSVFLSVFLWSCQSRQKPGELNYMKDVEESVVEMAARNTLPVFQPGDQVVILVGAKNMEVVKPFNQNYYKNQSPTGTSTPNSEKAYLVDSSGNIDFPVLGLIPVSGRTPEQLKEDLTARISVYVKDPTLTVRLANFKITFLGEVNRPGQYTIPEGQSTFYNALGLAGDLTVYGKRSDVLLVRSANGQLEKVRLDLRDPNFINSPYFELKQGDVIYVASNETKEKIARQDPNTNLYLAIAGTLIGLAGIFITIFKK